MTDQKTMKAVVVKAAGGNATVVDGVSVPKPGSGQILVKPLWLAINPVDKFMVDSGILVVDWPITIGVDTSAVVVEASSEARQKYNLNVGDYVCGCTRLGSLGYAAGQEYHLMDAQVTIPKPRNITVEQAATVGVGSLTAALALFQGLGISLDKRPSESVWILVLGGASSVGKFAVQIAIAAGYKVVTTCSERSRSIVEALGAQAVDYKSDLDKQVKQIESITGGVSLIFDATSAENPVIAKELFKRSTIKDKFFTTTNDWSNIGDFEGGKSHYVVLGPIGRESSTELNNTLGVYIPKLVKLIEGGQVKPSEYEIVGEGGWSDIVKAYEYQQTGKAGPKKVIVKVQDE